MKASKSKAQVSIDNIKSVKDAAYQFVRTNETSADIARFIINQDPTFPNEVSVELKADLNAGFMLRANELWGQDAYRVGDTGILIKVANSNDPDYLEKIGEHKGLKQYNINVAYAMSQQEFGQLKSKDPQEHAIVKAWRDKFSKYAHNNLAALKLAARHILNDGKTRERTATKNFDEALKDMFDAYEKRVKVAEGRGDTTASPVKYKVAVDAFMRVYHAE